MKQCRICSAIKDESYFCTKKYKGGVRITRGICKSCNSDKAKQRYADESQEDRERRKLIARQWRDNNKDKVRELKRKDRQRVKVIRLSSVIHEAHVIAYNKNKTKEEKLFKLKHDSHVKLWKSYPDIMYKWNYKHNINALLYAKLKRGVYRAIGKSASFSGWPDKIDFTIDQLKDHLESQFVLGMNWDNRHDWHIDHIVPIKAFNIKDVDSKEFKACFSLHNLRPVWPKENREKYWKIDRFIIKDNKINDLGSL